MNTTKQKSVSQYDVMTYFKAAPLEVLDQLQHELEKCIEKRKNTDNNRDNVRSLLSNINLVPQEPVKTSIFDSSPLPGQSAVQSNKVKNSQIELPSLFDSAPMPGGVPQEPHRTQEPNQAVKINPVVNEIPSEAREFNENSEIFDALLVFMYGDNYGDGLFGVKDEELKKILQEKKEECVEDDEHFPYGYGRGNDLLKIKGFKRPHKGEIIRIQIELRRWENKGRAGFSCYKA